MHPSVTFFRWQTEYQQGDTGWTGTDYFYGFLQEFHSAHFRQQDGEVCCAGGALEEMTAVHYYSLSAIIFQIQLQYFSSPLTLPVTAREVATQQGYG